MPSRKETSKADAPLPRVFVLRGPPGVGKSTVAHKIIPLLGREKKALVPIDVLQHFDHRGISEDKIKLGVYHAVIICRSFVREGFDVVVESVFNKHLDFFIEKLFTSHSGSTDPCILYLAYLDAPLTKIIERNSTRPDEMPRSVLTKLYNEADITKGMPGEIVIDTGLRSMNPKKIAKSVIENPYCLHEAGKILSAPSLNGLAE